MSVVLTSCVTCGTGAPTIEDLLKMAFVCDGTNAYLRIYNPFNADGTVNQYCGLIGDYTPEVRTFDGVDYTGILITHSLNKTTGLFLAVTDDESKTVTASAFIIDANSIFLVLDGLTDGGFCVS